MHVDVGAQPGYGGSMSKALRDRRFVVLWEHNAWEGETWGLAIPLQEDGEDPRPDLADDELLALLDAWSSAEDVPITVTDGSPFSVGYSLAALGAMADASPTSYSSPVSIMAVPAIIALRTHLAGARAHLGELTLYKGLLSRGEVDLCDLDQGAIEPDRLFGDCGECARDLESGGVGGRGESGREAEAGRLAGAVAANAPPNPERYIETKSVRHALLALLDSRDFLGHQLSHAQEIIDDEQMEEIEDEFFERRRAARPHRDELYRYARDILSVIGERCDSDVMAEMLSVDIDEATEVLRHVLSASEKDRT